MQSCCVCRGITLRCIRTLSCLYSYCRQCIVNMLHGLSSLVVAADAAFPPSCHASRFRRIEATGACVTEAVILSTSSSEASTASVASHVRSGGVSQASSLHMRLRGRLSLCRGSCLLLERIPQQGAAQCTSDDGICAIDGSVGCKQGKF